MKKCPFCNAELDENSNFCLYCMKSLEKKEVIGAKVPHKKTAVYFTAVVLALTIILCTINFLPKTAPKSSVYKGTSQSENQSTDQITPPNNNENNESGTTDQNPTDTTTTPQKPSNNNTVTNNNSNNNSNSTITNSDDNNNSADVNQEINNTPSNNQGVNNKVEDTEEENQNTGGTSSSYSPSTNDKSIYENLTYEIKPENYGSSNMVVTITGYTPNLSGDVVIPRTIDGYLVKTIGDTAFRNCKSITSVTFPSGLSGVGTSAFENCTSLKKITSDSIIIYGGYSFKNCTSLKEVAMPYLTYTGYNMFEGCTALENIWLQTDDISASAFKDCTKLKSVTIMAPLFYNHITIRNNAFSGCVSLTNFNSSLSLDKISIWEGNEPLKNAAFNASSLFDLSL